MHYQSFNRSTDEPSGTKITVIGEGKISVQPDKADITLGVVTEDTSLEQAQTKNANSISQVKKALLGLGISDEQMQTVNYSISPQYDYIDGKQVFRNYRVEHLLKITVLQIENVGLVVDSAVQHGATTITEIQFDTSKYNQYYRQALSLAVLDAGQKAETIANTLKIKLTRIPLKVTEQPKEHRGPIPYHTMALAKSEITTPIQPGTIQITSTITAEFT